MNVSNMVKDVVRRSLRRMGYNLYRLSHEERLAYVDYERHLSQQTLATVFGADVARLRELRTRYAQVRLPIAIHSVWSAKGGGSDAKPDIGWGGVDLRTFRSHSAYVWSYTGQDMRAAKLTYYIFTEAAKRKDTRQLLQTLKEDGAFGCINFEYAGTGRVSRDLLDSIIELNFLHKHLGILSRDDLQVLDIGAGYGRMAHRMLEANPRLASYTCVDAVPESTFLCEFYLKYRGLASRAQVLPLDELENGLVPGKYNLALNIHSFSECTYAAIGWWLRRLKQLGVRHLMIVPNDPTQFQSMEVDRSRRDYAPLLAELGYRLIAQEPVFDDPSVQDMLGVRDNMFLFECEPQRS